MANGMRVNAHVVHNKKGSYGQIADHSDGLVQEIRNSITSALELRLSGTNPSIFNMALE